MEDVSSSTLPLSWLDGSLETPVLLRSALTARLSLALPVPLVNNNLEAAVVGQAVSARAPDHGTAAAQADGSAVTKGRRLNLDDF